MHPQIVTTMRRQILHPTNPQHRNPLNHHHVNHQVEVNGNVGRSFPRRKKVNRTMIIKINVKKIQVHTTFYQNQMLATYCK